MLSSDADGDMAASKAHVVPPVPGPNSTTDWAAAERGQPRDATFQESGTGNHRGDLSGPPQEALEKHQAFVAFWPDLLQFHGRADRCCRAL